MAQPFLWFSALLLTTGIAALVWRLTAKRPEKGGSVSLASDRLASGYYRPMARLLAESEFDQLRTAGRSNEEIRRFRSARRKVFRKFLRDLRIDFQLLHSEARLLLRDSAADRPELAAELVRQYANFQFAVLFAQARLAIHWTGLTPIQADTLLAPAGWMRQQIEILRPQPTGLPAA